MCFIDEATASIFNIKHIKESSSYIGHKKAQSVFVMCLYQFHLNKKARNLFV